MYLFTPDKKMLRCQSDLKLYIAKAGAIIDSNIVNFCLPKKTAKVEKALGKLLAKSDQQQQENEISKLEVTQTEEKEDTITVTKQSEDNKDTEVDIDVSKTEEETETEERTEREKKDKRVKREMKMLGVLARKTTISRRETKVPLKYRMDDELVTIWLSIIISLGILILLGSKQV